MHTNSLVILYTHCYPCYSILVSKRRMWKDMNQLHYLLTYWRYILLHSSQSHSLMPNQTRFIPQADCKYLKFSISVLYSFVCCLFCRKLTPYDDWNHIVIHVAMDNTVVINDISECGFPSIRHVNIKVILLCIGTSKWTLYTYATQLNSDWLFIAQSRVL